MNFRWCNRVVNCKLHLIVKLTDTAVCKTFSYIFQRCSFGLWRKLSSYDVLCVAGYTREMGASDECQNTAACSGFYLVPLVFMFYKTGIR